VNTRLTRPKSYPEQGNIQRINILIENSSMIHIKGKRFKEEETPLSTKLTTIMYQRSIFKNYNRVVKFLSLLIPSKFSDVNVIVILSQLQPLPVTTI
jgi:hypothetical protein